MTTSADLAAPQGSPGPDQSRIMQIGMGFWPSKVLLSAVELRLFTVLGSGGCRADEIVDKLALRSRAVIDFLDGLVALRLLERDGSGAEARYRNTVETGLFLDTNSPLYMGGFLEMCNEPALHHQRHPAVPAGGRARGGRAVRRRADAGLGRAGPVGPARGAPAAAEPGDRARLAGRARGHHGDRQRPAEVTVPAGGPGQTPPPPSGPAAVGPGWMLLGLVAGAVLPVQGAVNAQLRTGLEQPVAVALVSFLVAAIAISALLAVLRARQRTPAPRWPSPAMPW